jgi:hypothetical protein
MADFDSLDEQLRADIIAICAELFCLIGGAARRRGGS